MQLVLRKRICVNVNPGRQGFAHNLLRRMSTRSTIPGCGVTFEVVSNIPGVRPHRDKCQTLTFLWGSIIEHETLLSLMFCLNRMPLAQRTERCWLDSLPALTAASQAMMKPPSRNTSAASSVWRTSSLWIDSDRWSIGNALIYRQAWNCRSLEDDWRRYVIIHFQCCLVQFFENVCVCFLGGGSEGATGFKREKQQKESKFSICPPGKYLYTVLWDHVI